MDVRQHCVIAALMGSLVGLAGCGGSTFGVQNPPPPPQQNVTIAFAAPPPTGIAVNGTASLTANVTNDPSDAGVDWALSCVNQQTFGCGTLSASHTSSGAPVTFTPPTAFSGNSDEVNIVAYATATHSANTLAPITITAFGNVLQGTYVLQVKGNDSTFSFGFPYQLTGEVYLDGNGNIASAPGGNGAGQQTLNTYDVNSNLDSTTSAITGGSYFIGADGRGMLTINTKDASGDAIEEDFSFVVVSSAEASIAQLGGTLTNSQGSTSLLQSGTGTLQLQDPGAIGTLPSAGWAFAASGMDSSGTPIVYGGVINIDSPSGISGNGTITDQGYNGQFTTCSTQNGFAGSSVSAAGVPGVVTFNLQTTCSGFGPTQIVGYIVDATHIQLIETDGSYFASGAGIGQGSATGTFTSFSGTYIFDAEGIDLTSLLPSSLTSVDVVSADGSGNIAGYTDTSLLSDTTGNPALVSSQITGLYQLDNKGIGRVHLRVSPPVAFFDPSMVLYLTAPVGTPGAPALVLYLSAANQRYPALGAGIGYPQAQPAQSLSFGNGELYSFLFTQENGAEDDGSGQITATSTAGAGGNFSGLVDDSANGFAVTPQALTGAFACPQGAASCPDAYGRFSASSLTANSTTAAVDYFMIDQNNGFFVETDAPTAFQVATGSFTQRCDVTNGNSCQQAAVEALRKRGWKISRRPSRGKTK